MKQKVKRRSSGKRTAFVILNCFLAVILVLMLGVTAITHAIMNKMNRADGSVQNTVSQQEMQDYLEQQQGESGVKGPNVNENDVDWGEMLGTILGDSDDVVNILLIGQDRREGESRARSDAMILVTINKDTKSIVLTSFLRDLYVQIPGYQSNRINASYVWGGMDLLNQTLKQNFGIHIDGNVEVDFSQFADIVDLLGGVEIQLRSDEANLINSEVGSSLAEGLQTLNGVQALTYSRIRKLDADGDFSRTQRQRVLIDALIAKVKDSSFLKLLSIVDDVLPMVTTDMTNAEIIGHATALFPMLSKATITSQRIPADGAYSYASIDGMSVLLADMDAARQLLQQTIGD